MPIEPFGIERYFARHEFTTPWLLGVSDCESMTVGDLLSLEPGAEAALAATRLGYTESAGGQELREAIAAVERDDPAGEGLPALEAGHVLVHAAGVEVVFALAHALLGRDDHVIVQTPCYQILRSAPAMTGAKVSFWRARPENGWAPDPKELFDLVRSNTRLIVVNTPHNPTGFHFDREGLERVIAIAEDRGITVLVDEAYRGGEYHPADRLPCAARLSERVCSLGLLSKAHGLPGLRVGWLATRNEGVLRAVATFKDYTTICSPAPSEFLGALALRHADLLLERTRRRLVGHLDLLAAFMDRWSRVFDWVPPRAGPITFPLLRAGRAADLSARLREEAGVLVVPSALFDSDLEAIRIGFGRENFPEGLAVLDHWLEGNAPRVLGGAGA